MVEDDDKSGHRLPSDLWLSLMLLGGQVGLYLIYPQLVHWWEFPLMAIPAVALQGLILWECRHWVELRAMHVIHLLILLDTFVEGLLQHWVRKPARVNLYCVAAFATVIVLYRLLSSPRKPA